MIYAIDAAQLESSVMFRQIHVHNGFALKVLLPLEARRIMTHSKKQTSQRAVENKKSAEHLIWSR